VLLAVQARAILSFDLPFEDPTEAMDSFVDGILDKNQSAASILQAMGDYRDCTNDAEECLHSGVVNTSATCFTLCIRPYSGCRSCCPSGTCYSLGIRSDPLGSCTPCKLDSTPPAAPVEYVHSFFKIAVPLQV
jgi:hypothetical protein